MNKFQRIIDDYIKFPLYLITHPVAGYMDFKEKKRGKMSVAVVYLITMSIVSILQFLYNGIIINNNNPMNFSSIWIMVYTITPVIILSGANWCITTLMNGKGKLKEVFIMGSYSYFPLIIGGILVLGLSNVVTTNEVEFLWIINFIASALSVYMIFTGLMMIHEYTIIKAIATVILTILSLAVIMFVALLIFDLTEQIYGFLSSLYKEIVTRYF